MTYQTDCTLPAELLEQIAQQGFDVLPDLIQTVINAAMQLERQKHLGVGPYERSAERQGQAQDRGDPVSAKSPLMCPRCAKAAFIPKRWKRNSAASGP